MIWPTVWKSAPKARTTLEAKMERIILLWRLGSLTLHNIRKGSTTRIETAIQSAENNQPCIEPIGQNQRLLTNSKIAIFCSTTQ